LSALLHATILLTSGTSSLHSRITSDVHACCISGVPRYWAFALENKPAKVESTIPETAIAAPAWAPCKAKKSASPRESFYSRSVVTRRVGEVSRWHNASTIAGPVPRWWGAAIYSGHQPSATRPRAARGRSPFRRHRASSQPLGRGGAPHSMSILRSAANMRWGMQQDPSIDPYLKAADEFFAGRDALHAGVL
jgi:hypothetical protein